MDAIIKNFLTSLGALGVLLAILWWWLQRYLDRRLNAHFNILETRLKGETETAGTLRKKRLEKTAELLPILQHAVSACRNCLRNLKNNLGDKELLEFSGQREAYIDVLYSSQLLLLPSTYETAHMFKGVVDRVNILLGYKINEARRLELIRALDRAVAELNEVHSALQAALRNELHIIEQLPGNMQP